MKKPKIKHVIPYELAGIATLLVDYLSRLSAEIEMLSVLLATLIIGILFDMRGYLDNFWVAIVYGVVVALEFVFVAAIAYKKRELEAELWGAVHELESNLTTGSDSKSDR